MSSLSATPVELTPVLDPAADALANLENAASGFSAEQRTQIAQCLGTIIECVTRGRGVWQQYADSPAESDIAFTPVMRIGPERARELHRVHLELRQHARTITDLSKVAFRDTIGFSSQIDVVQAYGELGPDETGAQRAAQAISTLDERIERLERVAKQFS